MRKFVNHLVLILSILVLSFSIFGVAYADHSRGHTIQQLEQQLAALSEALKNLIARSHQGQTTPVAVKLTEPAKPTTPTTPTEPPKPSQGDVTPATPATSVNQTGPSTSAQPSGSGVSSVSQSTQSDEDDFLRSGPDLRLIKKNVLIDGSLRVIGTTNLDGDVNIGGTPAALRVRDAAPSLIFVETDQAAPSGLWRWNLDNDILTLQKNTAVAGDFSTFFQPLTVTAATTTIANSLVVGGTTVLGNVVLGDATLSNLIVNNNLTVSGLSVLATTSMTGPLTVTNNALFQAPAIFTAAGTALTVANNANFGSASIAGSLLVGGPFNVLGSSFFASPVTFTAAGTALTVTNNAGLGSLTTNTITSPAALTVSAGGVNQNILLNPSGTGTVNIGGNSLIVSSRTSDPITASNGQIYYNTALNKFRVFEGGVWKSIVADGAAPAFPQALLVSGYNFGIDLVERSSSRTTDPGDLILSVPFRRIAGLNTLSVQYARSTEPLNTPGFTRIRVIRQSDGAVLINDEEERFGSRSFVRRRFSLTAIASDTDLTIQIFIRTRRSDQPIFVDSFVFALEP